MKAKITLDGILKITPENETESYALKVWKKGYAQGKSILGLHISAPIEKTRGTPATGVKNDIIDNGTLTGSLTASPPIRGVWSDGDTYDRDRMRYAMMDLTGDYETSRIEDRSRTV